MREFLALDLCYYSQHPAPRCKSDLNSWNIEYCIILLYEFSGGF